MRRILVTGQGGQLATGLAESLPTQGFEAHLVSQPDFECDKPETVIAAFAALRPEAVVNCAGRTAVDAAEDDEAGAFRPNTRGPALLARLCAEAKIPLIQISTDYVYDGLKEPLNRLDFLHWLARCTDRRRPGPSLTVSARHSAAMVVLQRRSVRVSPAPDRVLP